MATSVKQEETDTATTLIHHHDTITAPQDSDDATANGNGTEMMDTSDTDGTDGTDDKSQRENSTDLDSSSATINSQAEPKEERAVSAEDAAKYDQARGVSKIVPNLCSRKMPQSASVLSKLLSCSARRTG